MHYSYIRNSVVTSVNKKVSRNQLTMHMYKGHHVMFYRKTIMIFEKIKDNWAHLKRQLRNQNHYARSKRDHTPSSQVRPVMHNQKEYFETLRMTTNNTIAISKLNYSHSKIIGYLAISERKPSEKGTLQATSLTIRTLVTSQPIKQL